MKKYVWLNIQTGEFSDSWDEDTQRTHGMRATEYAKKSPEWKLIEYSCLTDDEFEFMNKMKLR